MTIYDKYNKNLEKKLKKQKIKKNLKNKYNIKHNNTLMITGLKKIINPIIKSNFNENDLKNYCACFIVNANTIKDISNPRISKTPFKAKIKSNLNLILFLCFFHKIIFYEKTKWYVMSYSDFYKYKKIIESIKNNNMKSLIKI